ncbi:MAG: M28 family peptidase [Planctomycetaceae bacterium]|nr:M28 family peptidase [Planctomycetaceae bacterium]MBT6153477.1 M28 family peptidase [Planctomycetaceae bacterium]MBT6484006.1 M28 family peptidase [Planctomycetaceae bacterium]MBT6495475.1 M28 family peptidase [Planctomycetaceae bacterium]
MWQKTTSQKQTSEPEKTSKVKTISQKTEVPRGIIGEPDARRAFRYLVKVCAIGPRISGTTGMAQQQKLIVGHFTKLGAQVRMQSFDVAHPQTGTPVRMNNIVVSWNKQAKERVLLACHYDTRPFPDRDRVNPRGRFIGANDGGSGVALFMELGHHMQKLQPQYGVDFVFFDGEELVYEPRDKYFLGSEHFARDYRDNPPEHIYVWGVLVDMIADRRLALYKEKNSIKYAPELVDSIWATARELKMREFIQRPKYEIRDDHLPLNDIAHIPTCDIIDFDYGPRSNPYWHTTKDIPANCSGTSIAKVGRVLLKWLTQVPQPKVGRGRVSN